MKSEKVLVGGVKPGDGVEIIRKVVNRRNRPSRPPRVAPVAAWGGRGARVRARTRPTPAHAARNHRPGPARRVPGAWACPRARHSPPSAAGARHFRPQNGERRRRRARKRRGARPRHSQPGQTSRTPRAWARRALFPARGSPGWNRSGAGLDARPAGASGGRGAAVSPPSAAFGGPGPVPGPY